MKKVLTFCDRHYQAEGEEVPAIDQPVRISIEDITAQEEVELELCEACRTELHQLLQSYLVSGRRPDATLRSKLLPKRPAKTHGVRAKCHYCDQMIVHGSGGASIHVSHHHPEEWAKEQATKAALANA